MSQQSVEIHFPDTTPDQAGRLADSLKQDLVMTGEDIQMHRKREDDKAQDFGAMLVLILGTAAVTAVAEGIRAWMQRTGTSIECNGVTIKNVDSTNLAAIVAALRGDGKTS
jgi:hypothetical protein